MAANFCTKCGASLAAEFRFCGNCGTPVSATEPKAPPSQIAPADYTPAHLAESIRSGRHALEGERKFLTVLFADIVGSTALIDGLDPEMAMARLDPTVQTMVECVHRFEGTVANIQGDGILALFGAPLAHEDHAVRGCYAALAMQQAVQAAQDGEINIRVGLHTGEVFVRSVGYDLRMEYDAIGPTVHLARRMEEDTATGTVQVTRATVHFAEGFVRATSLGMRRYRGVGAEIEVFQLGRSVGERSRWEARARTGLTEFISRGAQLTTLLARMDDAAEGHPQFFGLMGPPGMGKSRLVHEVIKSKSAERFFVLTTDAAPYHHNTPYRPISKLLRRWCGITSGDKPDDMRQKVAKLLHDHAPMDPWAETAFLSLLDVSIDNPAWAEMMPQDRREHIVDSVVQLCIAAAREAPTLLVFEDIHWVDRETLSTLNILNERLQNERLILLATFRPEHQFQWYNVQRDNVLEVDGFSPKQSIDLLNKMIGTDESTDALKRRIVARSAGTPLFLEETVRALVEEGLLSGEAGAYRASQDSANIRIPGTVKSVLAARLDRLSREQKRLVQLASVIGTEFQLNLLSALSGIGNNQLTVMLAELIGSDMFYAKAGSGEEQYAFQHTILREVAYSNLAASQRRKHQNRLLDAIVEIYTDRLDEFIEQLAHHAMEAENWPRAAQYLFDSGQKAHDRSAFFEARKWLEQASEVSDKLRDDAGMAPLGIEIRVNLRNIYNAVGEYQKVDACLNAAENLAVRYQLHRELISVRTSKAQLLCVRGENPQAIIVGRQAYDAAQFTGLAPLAMGPASILGWALIMQGDCRQAVQILEQYTEPMLDKFRHIRVGTSTGSVFYFGILAQAFGHLGEFDDGRKYLDFALTIAREVDRPYDIALARNAQGDIAMFAGDIDTAISHFSSGLELSRSQKMHAVEPIFASGLGGALVLAKKPEQAIDLLESNVASGGAVSVHYTIVWSQIYLALAYFRLRRLSEAEETLAHAQENAVKSAYRACEAACLRIQALLHIHQKQVEKAEIAIAEAIAIAEELDHRPSILCSQLVLQSIAHNDSNVANRTALSPQPIAEACLLAPQLRSVWQEMAQI